MIKNNQLLNVDYENVDYHPVILDYDFENDRPRGATCRIDFFSHGAVSSSLEGLKHNEKIYMKKHNIMFENGIFLIDFAKTLKKPDDFIKMVNDMKFTNVYIEKSKSYDLTPVLNKIENVEFTLMSFGCSQK